mmetsp:Transcript_41335/g.123431  ORF Transcript_41335/g.123431 Transcript_41335/m.123431 type:complete len:380 (-) Transcript_41335:912-2051(-)
MHAALPGEPLPVELAVGTRLAASGGDDSGSGHGSSDGHGSGVAHVSGGTHYGGGAHGSGGGADEDRMQPTGHMLGGIPPDGAAPGGGTTGVAAASSAGCQPSARHVASSAVEARAGVVEVLADVGETRAVVEERGGVRAGESATAGPMPGRAPLPRLPSTPGGVGRFNGSTAGGMVSLPPLVSPPWASRPPGVGLHGPSEGAGRLGPSPGVGFHGPSEGAGELGPSASVDLPELPDMLTLAESARPAPWGHSDVFGSSDPAAARTADLLPPPLELLVPHAHQGAAPRAETSAGGYRAGASLPASSMQSPTSGGGSLFGRGLPAGAQGGGDPGVARGVSSLSAGSVRSGAGDSHSAFPALPGVLPAAREAAHTDMHMEDM